MCIILFEWVHCYCCYSAYHRVSTRECLKYLPESNHRLNWLEIFTQINSLLAIFFHLIRKKKTTTMTDWWLLSLIEFWLKSSMKQENRNKKPFYRTPCRCIYLAILSNQKGQIVLCYFLFMLCYVIIFCVPIFLPPQIHDLLKFIRRRTYCFFVFSSIYEICSCRLFSICNQRWEKTRIQITLLSNSIQTNYMSNDWWQKSNHQFDKKKL